MQTEEFLRRILPPLDDGGCYCWATPAPADSGRRFDQQFTNRLDAAAERILIADAAHKNTYYAMAAFAKRGTREHANVKSLKAFWLDIDCGASKAAEGKGYATKKDGVLALLSACKSLGLPRPMVVDSGNGVHAYWPLAESIPADQWKPVALQLTAAFRSLDLLADYACSTDESRILRPIGTSNWKDPSHPKPVVLVGDCPDYALDQIVSAVGSFEVSVPSGPVVLGGINSDLDLQYDSAPANADSIADECAQMGEMRRTRGVVSEPQWRDCLGVIKHCTDPEVVAIEWSRGHPDFNHVATLAKLRQRKAPTRCETFDRDNPGLCSRCIHFGKISSPIQLGAEQPEAEVVASVAEPVVVKEPHVEAVMPEPTHVAEVKREMVIPKNMEATYQWVKGLLRVYKNESVGWVPFCQQLIVIDDVVDVAGEMVIQCRAQYPDGRERSFQLTVGDLVEKGTCIKQLARKGITPYNLKDTEMHAYLRKWYDEVSRKASDAKQLHHFGWQHDGSFLIGETLIQPNGEARFANIPYEMRVLANAMHVKGSPQEWRAVVDAFYSGENMEQYHFILGVGFGAPLMALTGINGVTFSALSESGFGKTACESIMLAIYGDPRVLLKSFKGMTQNSLYDYMGVMGSLPVVVDEITTVKPEQLADLAYDISSGQSKMRLDRDGKARAQRTPWHTILQTSSNSSLWEKLAAKGAVSDAQWLRMLEFNMQRNFQVSTDEARELMSRLEGNHGAVGMAYLTYIVEHREKVKKIVLGMMTRVEQMAGVEATERFWSAGVACVVAGLTIAKAMKLIDFDPQAVMQWAVNQIKGGRRELRAAAPGSLSLFKQMYSALAPSLLTTRSLSLDGDVDERFNNKPFSEYAGRTVVDINTTWLSASAARTWCANNHTSYANMIDAAKKAGFITWEGDFDIGEGTVMASAPVKCFKVDRSRMV